MEVYVKLVVESSLCWAVVSARRTGMENVQAVLLAGGMLYFLPNRYGARVSAFLDGSSKLAILEDIGGKSFD